MSLNTIAIYGRPIEATAIASLQMLLEHLSDCGLALLVHNDFAEHLHLQHGYTPPMEGVFGSADELRHRAQLMLSLGGDGTFLSAALLAGPAKIPVLGINFGSLGFLANVSLDEMQQAVGLLVDGNYRVEPRSLLEVHTADGLFAPFPYGLNDFTVQKGAASAMVSVTAYVNGEQLCTYRADGLIVATPTGSTAYSLGAGGPIITPNMEAFVLSPVAPHTLTFRPLVLPDTSEIRLEVESRSQQVMLSLDSRYVSSNTPLSLTVRRAPFTLGVVCVQGASFFKSLRGKLFWGADKRE